MLTPNEIASTKFDKYMGKGYKQDDVDSFLRQVASDMSALIEEKRDMERKLNILADKLEEYKNDEDSLRSALIGAQKLGDTVIREAKEKAARIMEEAQMDARRAAHEAQTAMERERASFARLQQEIASFKNKLQITYKQHLELISALPVDETATQAHHQAQQQAAQQAAEQQRQAAMQPQEEDEPAYEPEPPRETSRSSAASMPVSPRDREREYDATPISSSSSYQGGTIEEMMAAQAVTREIPSVYGDDDLPPVDELPLVMNEAMPTDGYEYETALPVEPNHKLGRYESRFGPLKFGSEYNIKREDEKRKK